MKHRTRIWSILFAACFLLTSTWGQQRRPITPEDYYSLQTIGDPQLSPDGKLVAYLVSNADKKQNNRHSEIWLAPTDGNREPRQLTNNSQSSSSPRWSPDGNAIAFLSARLISADGKAGKKQVQFLSLNGGEPRPLTNLKNGVESFDWSPDGTRLVCISTWGPSDTAPENAEKSDTRHYIHSTYKYDGQGFFDDRRQHLWVVDVKSGSTKQITEGDDWNDTDPAWSPDSTHILFSSDRTGKYWKDINHTSPALWVVPAEGGAAMNISGDIVVSGGGQWSPDGRSIAFFAGRFEEDPRILWTVSTAGDRKPKQIIGDLDMMVKNLEWGENGRALYWLSNVKGEYHIFRGAIDSGKVSQVTSGARFINSMNINNQAGSVAYNISAPEQPSDLYVSRMDGSQEVRITHLNDQWLKQVDVQPLERMSYSVEDGFTVDGFLVKPAGWQQGRKYPMILLIHGGPEGMYGTNWMFGVQALAARGWGVFYTNPRGSTGYGSKFVQAVIGEWGGKVYTDIQTGVDAVLKQNAWIDADKLGIIGCSFGGYMTNWTISHTTRFKAAVPMCSISDYVSDEGTRDEYYGHAHDFGGDLYQNFDLYWKYSPIRYAMNVKTPTLILHGEVDGRVPLEQAEQWFRALQHFHVPSEIVIFPRESHGGLSGGEPKHVVEAMNWQVYWFNRYLDGNSTAIPPDALKKVNKSANGHGTAATDTPTEQF